MNKRNMFIVMFVLLISSGISFRVGSFLEREKMRYYYGRHYNHLFSSMELALANERTEDVKLLLGYLAVNPLFDDSTLDAANEIVSNK